MADDLKQRLLNGIQNASSLSVRRKSALDVFRGMQFPTTKTEEWRFTNLRNFLQTPFEPAPEARLSLDELNAVEFADLGFPRAVFVNGHYAPELSNAEEADGISTAPLNEDAELGSADESESDIFDALNAAIASEGVVVRAAPGKAVETPLHLVYLTSPSNGSSAACHPRTLIAAGGNSQLTVIESHLSCGGSNGAPYFTNPVTEIVCQRGAVVDHYKLQAEAEEAFHIGSTRSRQERDSSFATHTITLGAGLLRNNLTATLDGPGASATLHAFYLATGNQHVDHFTTLIHARENCNSREVYKGVLDDASRAVFHGRILVKQDAQDTDSYQQNENLLLTKRARVNTKPQLEIYADQVKCSHGATVGELDEEAMFYLRSRCIGEPAARSLLIYAFASEVIDQIKPEPLRSKLQDELFAWLPEGAAAREAF